MLSHTSSVMRFHMQHELIRENLPPQNNPLLLFLKIILK
jgi:hypothetical protein